MTDEQVDAMRARALRLAEAGAPLSAPEMAALFREGLSQFYKKAKVGVYDVFKLETVTGPKCYSGVRVARHFRGLPLYEPTFGRKRA